MHYQNNRLIDALHLKPVDATPVWLMRQAGRYLPEYRAVRAQAQNFVSLCKNPELACEVTLQPLRRFDLDAAIIFSDILTIPDALGLPLKLIEQQGPCFDQPIQTEQDLQRLHLQALTEKLSYTYDAIRLVKAELKDRLPIIGFAGSPWTMATYMVEGHATKEFRVIKTMLYAAPTVLHQLLNLLAEAVIQHLQAQANAGCGALMIFDTWGGILTTAAYQEFSLQYMKKIVTALKASHPNIPVILFTKGGGLWLKEIAATKTNAIGLDWTIDIAKARDIVENKVALQGNLDPMLLYASPQTIKTEVEKILTAYGPYPGHIFNLGHGITPQVNPDHVQVLIEAVHNFFR